MSTAPTPIPDYTADLPDPADPDTFTSRGLAWWNHERFTAFPGMNNLAANAYENAVAAENAAATAATLAGAAMWNAATNYATGAAAISPITLQTYRRKSPGGVDATDPSASANWTIISGDAIKKSGDTGISSQSFAAAGYLGKDADMAYLPSHSNAFSANAPIFKNPLSNLPTMVGVAPNGTSTTSGFFAKAGNGSTDKWGGLVVTNTSVEIHSSHANTPSVPGPVQFKFSGATKFTVNTNGTLTCYGVAGRQGSSGATPGNTVNFWWTGSAMEVWVDGSKVGTMNITP